MAVLENANNVIDMEKIFTVDQVLDDKNFRKKYQVITINGN